MPAAQADQAPIDVASNSMGSPESDRPSPESEMRGSTNPDGSMNLGFRNREDVRTQLPNPTAGRQNGGLPSSDLMAYSSTSSSHYQGNMHDPNDSLNNENRLPPMASYPSPTQGGLSLSSHAFLSPSHKRSFSSLDTEERDKMGEREKTQPKRLSSIKSILNPGSEEFPDSAGSGGGRSPGRYPAVNNYASNPNPQQLLGGGGMSTSQNEKDRAKLKKKEVLQAETRRMREALMAKERELEEMGE